eukprot:570840-Pelagomonas_calceolata.AAC.10
MWAAGDPACVGVWIQCRHKTSVADRALCLSNSCSCHEANLQEREKQKERTTMSAAKSLNIYMKRGHLSLMRCVSPSLREKSGGNVARNAENLAKPVLPDTGVALICSAWGNNGTFLQQSMP